jgi:predicted esterase
MEISTFEDLQTRFQELYASGEFEEAMQLVSEQAARFPEYEHLLYYWRIALAARLANPGQAIALLSEVLKSGFWYGETLLRKSPALKSLQGIPEFEKLVALNQDLQEEEATRQFPLLVLRAQDRCKSGKEACPLMIALHANAGTARESVTFWQPAASAGWLVGAPQSSQAIWKGAYVWDDLDRSRQEILKAFDSLTKQYSVDSQQIALAGHSMGGEVAIWLALTGAVPAAGFIAFGPDGPFMNDLENWMGVIYENQNPDLRGYLIVGEEDNTISPEAVEDLTEMLNRGGIACELEKVPHAGHDYAPEYEASMLRALAFISGE